MATKSIKKIAKKPAKKKVNHKEKLHSSLNTGSNMANSETDMTLAIVGFIINIVLIPGLGSIIGGRTKEGIWQLIILFGSILLGILLVLTVVGALIGIPLLFGGPLAAWIWGIITGVDMIKHV